MSRGPVKIERFDPTWRTTYEVIKEQLQTELEGKHRTIYHVGSTSVEGLGGKPTIDVLVTIESDDMLDDVIQPIESLGYDYVRKYEDEFPFRRYFVKRIDGGKHQAHLHIVPHGHDFYRNHLYFREFLRKYIDIRDEYHLLKTRLSNKHKENRQGYQDGKSDFINRMIEYAMEEFDDEYIDSLID